MKRYRPGPHPRREFVVLGQSVQVDVKYLKLEGQRFYQFTAVDEATGYRILRIYEHASIPNLVAFIDEVRQRLPMAIQRVQADNGNEFGTDFTWHLRDLGIAIAGEDTGRTSLRAQHYPASCSGDGLINTGAN